VSDLEPNLDLLETRRQLAAVRSLHSHNRRVAIAINKLIGKIAHLHRPNNLAHEKQLVEMIARTWRAVELILSQETAASSDRRCNGKDARGSK
jgi:hypothetical protein